MVLDFSAFVAEIYALIQSGDNLLALRRRTQNITIGMLAVILRDGEGSVTLFVDKAKVTLYLTPNPGAGQILQL